MRQIGSKSDSAVLSFIKEISKDHRKKQQKTNGLTLTTANTLPGEQVRPYPGPNSAPRGSDGALPFGSPTFTTCYTGGAPIETLYQYLLGKVVRGFGWRFFHVEDFVEDFFWDPHSSFVNQKKSRNVTILGWTSYGTSPCFSSWFCMCFFSNPWKFGCTRQTKDCILLHSFLETRIVYPYYQGGCSFDTHCSWWRDGQECIPILNASWQWKYQHLRGTGTVMSGWFFEQHV